MSNYIITSDGSFVSEDEYLQHWGIKKGDERPDHKYSRREWKNGRWVYYYDLPTAATLLDAEDASEKPIGQNYTVRSHTAASDNSNRKPTNMKEYVEKLITDIEFSSAGEKLYYIFHPREKKEYEKRKKNEKYPTYN